MSDLVNIKLTEEMICYILEIMDDKAFNNREKMAFDISNAIQDQFASELYRHQLDQERKFLFNLFMARR